MEEKLTILAIGPQTNIASAILLMQTTKKDHLINIDKVVVCGGSGRKGSSPGSVRSKRKTTRTSPT